MLARTRAAIAKVLGGGEPSAEPNPHATAPHPAHVAQVAGMQRKIDRQRRQIAHLEGLRASWVDGVSDARAQLAEKDETIRFLRAGPPARVEAKQARRIADLEGEVRRLRSGMAARDEHTGDLEAALREHEREVGLLRRAADPQVVAALWSLADPGKPYSGPAEHMTAARTLAFQLKELETGLWLRRTTKGINDALKILAKHAHVAKMIGEGEPTVFAESAFRTMMADLVAVLKAALSRTLDGDTHEIPTVLIETAGEMVARDWPNPRQIGGAG